ncbi:MAG: hypothetical protein IPP60_01180 [Sphingobacteriales bacterium]|nr:hypothetical protein [Sphingobacteriales bacterium]
MKKKKTITLSLAFVLAQVIFAQNTTDGNAKPNVIPKTTIDKTGEGNASSTSKTSEGAADTSTTQKTTEGAADAGNAAVTTNSKGKKGTAGDDDNSAVKKKHYYKKVAKFKPGKEM